MGSEASAVAGVVLAAGRSSRMGRPKSDVRLGGQTLLARALTTLGQTSPLAVVVAPGRVDAALAAGAVAPVDVVVNPDPDRGMLSSIATGLQAVGGGWTLLLPVDCPLVPARAAALLVASRRATPRCVAVVPKHAGRRGHPVLLGPDVCRAVERAVAAQADTHLEAILQGFGERVVEVDVEDEAILDNVNTPGDVERLRARRTVET